MYVEYGLVLGCLKDYVGLPVRVEGGVGWQNHELGNKLLEYPADGLSRQPHIQFLNSISNNGRDSSVGIATRYGLDGPGIKSR